MLTDTSGSRRYIGVEVTGVIDVVRPVDYEQLYAQAMAALYHNERYWFDEKEEAIMTEANQEFEQSPLIERCFLCITALRTMRKKESGYLLPIYCNGYKKGE